MAKLCHFIILMNKLTYNFWSLKCYKTMHKLSKHTFDYHKYTFINIIGIMIIRGSYEEGKEVSLCINAIQNCVFFVAINFYQSYLFMHVYFPLNASQALQHSAFFNKPVRGRHNLPPCPPPHHCCVWMWQTQDDSLDRINPLLIKTRYLTGKINLWYPVKHRPLSWSCRGWEPLRTTYHIHGV